MATKILNKLFFHISGYDDAPEFSIDDKGLVRINDEIVEDHAAIVNALADNARAWAKCLEKAVDLSTETPLLEGMEAETVVQQYTGIEIHGPWPRREAEEKALSLTDEQITEIEGGDVVG